MWQLGVSCTHSRCFLFVWHLVRPGCRCILYAWQVYPVCVTGVSCVHSSCIQYVRQVCSSKCIIFQFKCVSALNWTIIHSILIGGLQLDPEGRCKKAKWQPEEKWRTLLRRCLASSVVKNLEKIVDQWLHNRYWQILATAVAKVLWSYRMTCLQNTFHNTFVEKQNHFSFDFSFSKHYQGKNSQQINFALHETIYYLAPQYSYFLIITVQKKICSLQAWWSWWHKLSNSLNARPIPISQMGLG